MVYSCEPIVQWVQSVLLGKIHVSARYLGYSTKYKKNKGNHWGKQKMENFRISFKNYYSVRIDSSPFDKCGYNLHYCIWLFHLKHPVKVMVTGRKGRSLPFMLKQIKNPEDYVKSRMKLSLVSWNKQNYHPKHARCAASRSCCIKPQAQKSNFTVAISRRAPQKMCA